MAISKKALQEKYDLQKWVASETAGRDLCGEAFEFCAYCDKSLALPCATAALAMKKAAAPKTTKTTKTKAKCGK